MTTSDPTATGQSVGPGHAAPQKAWGSTLPRVTVLLLFAGHALLAWICLGGYAGITSPHPILVDDHNQNFYSVAITRTFLRESGTTSGYDPHFMAGYARSVIWPSSTTLPEVIAAAAGDARPELVYKLFVFVAFILTLVGVWLALRMCTSPAEVAVGLILFFVLFWTDMPIHYMRYGMVSFVLSSTVGLLTGVCFARLLEQPGRAMAVGLLILLPVAVLTHVSVPVVIGPPLVVVYAALVGHLRWGVHGLLWSAAIVAIVANLPWLLPGVLLWQTRGQIDPVFVNPEGLKRLLELFGELPWIELVLLAFGVLGLALAWRCGARERWVFVAACGWAFFLGYAAGGLGILQPLQPGRHTLNLLVWCVAPAAMAICRTVHLAKTRGGSGLGWAAALCLALAGVVLHGPLLWANVRTLFRAPTALLPSDLPVSHRVLLDWIGDNAQPGDRLFFEERSRGFPDGPDPMQTQRLSGLIPLKHRVELIGGPYLLVHLQTAFTQIGDGRFIGGSAWERRNFQLYQSLYAAKYVICWSTPARIFCRSNPDLVRVIAESEAFLIAAVQNHPGPALRGRARVHAELNRIEVRDAEPEGGELVLRYHWVPGLVTEPPLRLTGRRFLNDPVPFIVVHDAPPEFVIRFKIWSLLVGQ